ncbi:MAG: NADH-quinone oxidoreductase subunit M, partial [Rhodospirillaceae bacterium]|nr:NADH-quinone oxidoreductase subunit M [Rhodospirillaceae bacterium]
MSELPLLSLLIFLPLVGALIVLTIRGDDDVVARNARNVALWASMITFALSIMLWAGFETGTADFQFVEKSAWLPELNIGYHLGVDGISMLFVVLSAFLTPICILASWEAITSRVKEYMIAFLVLESLMIGVFCAL